MFDGGKRTKKKETIFSNMEENITNQNQIRTKVVTKPNTNKQNQFGFGLWCFLSCRKKQKKTKEKIN